MEPSTDGENTNIKWLNFYKMYLILSYINTLRVLLATNVDGQYLIPKD